MAETMLLPPDAEPTAIAFDLPAVAAPYFRELYENQKQGAETPDEFICRMACEAGVRFVMQTRIMEITTAAETKATTDDADIRTEFSEILAAL